MDTNAFFFWIFVSVLSRKIACEVKNGFLCKNCTLHIIEQPLLKRNENRKSYSIYFSQDQFRVDSM